MTTKLCASNNRHMHPLETLNDTIPRVFRPISAERTSVKRCERSDRFSAGRRTLRILVIMSKRLAGAGALGGAGVTREQPDPRNAVPSQDKRAKAI